MADATVLFEGWGRSTWNSGTFGEPVVLPGAVGTVGTATGLPSIEVEVTGVSATVEVGTADVVISVNVPVTGLEATGSVGKVFVWSEIDPSQDPGWTEVSPAESTIWTEIAA
jgi:hypothetical protein